MLCPVCGRDHVENEDSVLCEHEVQWWGDCECGYESFPTLYGERISPELAAKIEARADLEAQERVRRTIEHALDSILESGRAWTVAELGKVVEEYLREAAMLA